MVMMCQPVWDAFEHVEKPRAGARRQRVYFTPQGTPLSQELVVHLATCEHLVMLAGHYEGIDERVIEELAPLEVSLGDFVVSGGEVAALVTIDAIARLLPGVLGHEDSSVQDSFSVFAPPQGFSTARDGLSSSKQSKRLLDCPHYTRPEAWRGQGVPAPLLSGHHAQIAEWRRAQSLALTVEKRPDLIDQARQQGLLKPQDEQFLKTLT
jgi:tRNA (guanine37-N1)-methyltransferase